MPVNGCAVVEALINISQMFADVVIIMDFLFFHVQTLFLTKHVGKMLYTQLCEEQIQKRPDQFVREIRYVAIKFWVSSRAPNDLVFLKNRARLLNPEQNGGMRATHRDWSLSRPI